MRIFMTLAALLAGTPALANDLPQRGSSTLARMEAGPGLAVEEVANLRMMGRGLRFADGEGGQFAALTLTSGNCTVMLEDRNGNGDYETRNVREDGVMAMSCSGVPNPIPATALEAGDDITAFSDCRFHIRADYTVECQPTRFGNDHGEAWTVLSGFTDAHMRQATGAPVDLAWDRGLLVLDDLSGIIYRVVEAPFVPTEDIEPAPLPYLTAAPQPPSLMRTSGIPDLPVTSERQKVIDDREATFSKYRKSSAEQAGENAAEPEAD